MFLYGFWGFVIGMVLGALLNKRLLKNVPRERWLGDRDLKLKYGALNWAFGIAGLVLGLYIAQHIYA